MIVVYQNHDLEVMKVDELSVLMEDEESVSEVLQNIAEVYALQDGLPEVHRITAWVNGQLVWQTELYFFPHGGAS